MLDGRSSPTTLFVICYWLEEKGKEDDAVLLQYKIPSRAYSSSQV